MTQRERALQRRLQKARFPVLKTLAEFQWEWPRAINRDLVRHLFGLDFMKHLGNVCFLGSVGLGKTQLAIALRMKACERGHSVLFTTVIDAINQLL